MDDVQQGAGGGEVARAALGAGAAWLTTRSRPDAEPPASLDGLGAWTPVIRLGLLSLLVSVWFLFSSDDTMKHLVGGLLAVGGLSAAALGVLAGAAIESVRPPPRTADADDGLPMPDEAAGPLSFGDLEVIQRPSPEHGPGVGVRAFLIPLPEGGVVVWGLVRWDDGLSAALTARGGVTALVVSSGESEPHLAGWQAAWPAARVVRSGDEVPLAAGLTVVALGEGPVGPELIALHDATGTALVSSLLTHARLRDVPGRVAGLRWELAACDDRLCAPLAWRLLRPPGPAFVAALRSAAAWQPDAVLVSHGRAIRSGAAEPWAAALRSLGVSEAKADPRPQDRAAEVDAAERAEAEVAVDLVPALDVQAGADGEALVGDHQLDAAGEQAGGGDAAVPAVAPFGVSDPGGAVDESGLDAPVRK